MIPSEKEIRVYRERDWAAQVEVLEDLSDEQFESYRLRLIKTLTAQLCIEDFPPSGAVFVCKRSRNEIETLWSLMPMPGDTL
jgi:hypothetical protein